MLAPFCHFNFMLGSGSPDHLPSTTLKRFLTGSFFALDVSILQINDEAIIPVARRHCPKTGALNPAHSYAIVLKFNTWLRCHSVTFNFLSMHGHLSLTYGPRSAAFISPPTGEAADGGARQSPSLELVLLWRVQPTRAPLFPG